MRAHGLPMQSPYGLDRPVALKVSHGHAKPVDHDCRRDYGKQRCHGGNQWNLEQERLGRPLLGG